ncbi:MAG TPA: ATP-binding protein, partial [Planctomycetes bacterium]|nr:ATP-binding protein [Planctomycetota bacterium]
MIRLAIERVQRRHDVDDGCFEVAIDNNVSLRSDSMALDTVMTNLLDNAVKYSNPPPRIEVVARMRDNMFQLRVTDHGIGVPRAHLSRI